MVEIAERKVVSLTALIRCQTWTIMIEMRWKQVSSTDVVRSQIQLGVVVERHIQKACYLSFEVKNSRGKK